MRLFLKINILDQCELDMPSYATCDMVVSGAYSTVTFHLRSKQPRASASFALCQGESGCCATPASAQFNREDEVFSILQSPTAPYAVEQ